MKLPTIHTLSSRRLRVTATMLLLSVLPLGCQRSEALPAKKQVPPVQVDSVTIDEIKSPILLRLTGSLEGERQTDLAANVAGKVLKTSVQRGDSVEAGALIAQVDTKAAQLALAEARISVETSRTQQDINEQDCQRYEKLHASGVVTDQEYDQVTAKCKTAPLSVEAAEARKQIAAKNVGDGMIRSPFPGVVTERYVEVGEYVQSSSRVVSIAQVDTLKLVFRVPERNYPNVERGATAHFRVAAYGEEQFSAKVARVSGAVSQTRDVVVEAVVENADRRLLPGMFADIELVIGQEKLPAVPLSATFEQNEKLNVLVIRDGTLEQRIIQAAPTIEGLVPVRRGLIAGDRVVKDFDDQLKNGQKVL